VFKARVLLVVGCVALLALGVVASASAGGKGGFVPKAGKYSGTFNNGTATAPATGTVAKTGKKFTVQALVGTAAKCSNGLVLVGVPLGVVAPVVGRTFKLTEEIEIPSAEGPRIWTVKLSGHFTSEKAFTGSVSASSPPIAGISISPSCATPNVTFTLKHS
jgi:hypothetical protein